MIVSHRGRSPRLAEDVVVMETAVVAGDVEIGAGSSIWFGAVVRGDVHFIRIGKLTNIQDGCLLHVTTDTHPLIIGNGVTVGHGAILHGCTVEDGALIGMGAIVLDGAHIGREALVAAGALVTEGTRVPPRTLVMGSPAKPHRELTSEELERLRRSAEHYRELAAGGWAANHTAAPMKLGGNSTA
ncbi:MAG: gamma carbonic anhydrase family protein [Pseudomonadota bacterium]